jgi:hypothetical protein
MKQMFVDVSKKAAVEVPEGYQLLPAGKRRWFGVYQDGWVSGKDARPAYLFQSPAHHTPVAYLEDVQILGPSRLVKENNVVCGSSTRIIRLETTAAVLVKVSPTEDYWLEVAEGSCPAVAAEAKPAAV